MSLYKTSPMFPLMSGSATRYCVECGALWERGSGRPAEEGDMDIKIEIRKGEEKKLCTGSGTKKKRFQERINGLHSM